MQLPSVLPKILDKDAFLQFGQGDDQDVADLIEYYVEGDLLDQFIYLEFNQADLDTNGLLTQEEFKRMFESRQFSNSEIDRLWDLCNKHGDDKAHMEWFEFSYLANLVYMESASKFVFSHFTGAFNATEYNLVSKEEVNRWIDVIWSNFNHRHSKPLKEEIDYVWERSSRKGDLLNEQEFFWFWATLMKSFKTHLSNVRYRNIILDNYFVIDMLGKKHKAQIGEKLLQTFVEFCTYAILEGPFLNVARELFNNNDRQIPDRLSYGEFVIALSPFNPKLEELSALWIYTNRGNDGTIDFAEFCSLFESYLYQKIANIAWKLVGKKGIVEYSDMRNLVDSVDLAIRPKFDVMSDFETLWKESDKNKDNKLDRKELESFIGEFLSGMRLKHLMEDDERKEKMIGGVKIAKERKDEMEVGWRRL